MSSLAITINAQGAQVAPGSAVSFTVEVRNLGTVVDRYRCEILGVDPNWVTITPASLELFPQRDGPDARPDAPPSVGKFTISLHPPRTSAAIAGIWTLGAKVSSEHDQGNRMVEEASIAFLPFGQVDAEIRPAQVGGRFSARARL